MTDFTDESLMINSEKNMKKEKGVIKISDDEKSIMDSCYFGDLDPCFGFVFAVIFEDYNKEQATYTGFMVDFDHKITMRAVDTQSSQRNFNSRNIDFGKVYYVKVDDTFFATMKGLNGSSSHHEEIKKIKTKLIKFGRKNSLEGGTLNFYDNHIRSYSKDYLVDIKDKIINKKEDDDDGDEDDDGEEDYDNVINDISLIDFLQEIGEKNNDEDLIKFISFLKSSSDKPKACKFSISSGLLDLKTLVENINVSIKECGISDNVTYDKSMVQEGNISTQFIVNCKSNQYEDFKRNITGLDDTVSIRMLV
tara:strand:- start:763 stop:1683 length:921 start_codon:yes stop_codon:yes gene_type:complete